MKTVNPSLQAILDSPSMQVARLVTIERTDGVTLRFTDHDEPLDVDGNTFVPGLVKGDIDQKTGLAPVNQGNELLIDDVSITREDLETGRFDEAVVVTELVAWDATALGTVKGLRGIMGQITINDTGGTTEARSLTDSFRQSISETFSTTCPYDLGDVSALGVAPGLPRCKVDLAALTVSGTVTTVIGALNNKFDAAALGAFADDYFQFGGFRWTSGPNAGRRNQVKEHKQGSGVGEITLEFPEPVPIAVTDGFDVAPGCRKDVDTCRDKFSNIENFGGFPFVPGQDKILKTGGQ